MRRPGEGDLVEAWSEVARLRQLALVAAREAAERRWLTAGFGDDPLHPRTMGLAAAADFHQGRAALAAERAEAAARLAAGLEARLQAEGGAARCA